MSKFFLLPEKGTFYKANLHCHSTHSDGKHTPEQLKKMYMERGYSVVAFSDHNVLVPHTELKDESFLPITSVEIAVTESKPDWNGAKTYHLNFFSVDENKSEVFSYDEEYSLNNLNRIIKKAKEEGFLVQYNHPRWSMQDSSDYFDLENLWGFEIYNHGCEIDMINGHAEYEYELVSIAGKHLACTASDDNHNWEDVNSPFNDSFGGFTMIKAENLTYSSMINALKEKNCYASTKPLIHELYITNDTVHIECSPCACIMLKTESRYKNIIRSNENDLQSVDLKMDFPYEHFKIECIDKDGYKAMTRAYFKDEIIL